MTTDLTRTSAPASTSLGGPARSRWGLLARREFRLLWAGESISRLGSSVTSVALPLVAVVSLEAGPLAVGLLSGAVWLPWLLLGLPAGVWVGRLPRRPVMIGCNLASAALFASVPVAGWLGALTTAQLLLVALLTGTAAVFFSAAYQAYLPELVHRDDLIEGNAKLQGSAWAAQVAGPGVAGLTVQWCGAAAGLLVDAVTFLVASAALLLIPGGREPVPAPVTPAPLRAQVREGLAFILRDRFLRSFLFYGASANFALTGYQSIALLFLVREVGVAPGAVGLLAAAGALGGVLGAVAARPLCRRLGTARAVRFALLAATPFGLLLPAAGPGPRVALYAIGSAVLVAGAVLCNVVLGSFRQTYAPPALLSRVVATSMFANQATIPLGAVAGGALGATLGLRATMWIMTGLLVSCGGLLLASPLRKDRDLPAGPATDKRSGR
ncbi:MFS transporter [Streptomyces sp. XY431]|uniref:MFS transporter n=1 Tax=Streptomyces sp. XY431 TaxID=1415562 RepID=UPI0006AE46BB|nr:MFS transporter [Streptomyces sp. XY431]KOV13334.1 MFS transporter [Streptomyces sp. XY431]